MLTLFLCIGLVAGEEAPSSLLVITGNTSQITEDTNGTYLFILNDIDQNATVKDQYQTSGIIFVEGSLPKDSCSAVFVLNDTQGDEAIFFGEVSDPTYTKEQQTLICNITPQSYYDGTLLQEFIGNSSIIEPGVYGMTSLYIEFTIPVKDNYTHPTPDTVDPIPCTAGDKNCAPAK